MVDGPPKLTADDLACQFNTKERNNLFPKIQRELMLRGELRHLTRPHGQRRIYDAVVKFKEENPKSLSPAVLNCHRRFGKSHFGALLGVQRAISTPGRRVRYGAATEDQVSAIVDEPMDKILHRLPIEIQPERRGRVWTFRNPKWGDPRAKSTFSIHPIEYMKGNRLRGMGATDWFLDEVRDLSDLDYLVKHVIGWHFIDALKEGFDPLLVMLSTPPESPAHPFSHVYIPQAEKDGTYFCIPSSENEDWSDEDADYVAELCGGRDTIAWLREAECRLIGDESKLVVPEFEPNADTIIQIWPRPGHFFAYIAADSGWQDHTGVVFFYVDFQAHKLIVEDEIFVQYKSTGEVADLVSPKFEELYAAGQNTGGSSVRTRWVADATAKELGTFGRDHGIHFQPADKHDKWHAVANLRTAFQHDWVRIHPRCKNLILQLRYGIKNKRNTDFERTDALGHLDLVAALVYGYRKVNWDENPFPKPSVRPSQDTMIDPYEHVRRMRSQQEFERMFPHTPQRRRRRR